jgi:glycosyltransferase involved in cell wall biosynthesis
LGKKFRKTFFIGENEVVIGYVARFAPQKNHLLLIKLVKDLPKNVKIIFVGGGELERTYEKLVSKLNMKKRIIFLGRLTLKNLLAFYNGIDIYACPSFGESFGLPLLEASACGIPVIAFNKTALKEVVLHSRTGFLAKDSKEFEKYLNVLIENEKLRKDLGKKARKFAIKFDWKYTVKKYERILRNTL